MSASATGTPRATPPGTQTKVTKAADPSGQAMPIGNLPGWRQVFTDDFTHNVPIGSFPAAVSYKWGGYPDGTKSTYGNGIYEPSKVVSIGNGMMNMYLHTENGVHMTAAPIPLMNGGYNSLTYGRYAIRFRVLNVNNLHGYKTAWLLWPDSDDWDDGEIDFPEGDIDGAIWAHMHHVNDPRTADDYLTTYGYDSWHTAILTWTPQAVTFTLDGKTVANDTRTSLEPTSSMHWVLQTETNESGPSDSASGNVQIDWVAIWAQA